MRAVESGFVSSVGPFVAEFEEAFARRVGARYAVACSSGTAALHVAFLVLGVRPGDEVLCSDFTFVGSVNPIAYTGARPVLVDSERATWNLDPGLVAAELDRRAAAGEPQPAAVEVVHVLGQPADLAPILDACARHGVPVVEDAAESLGAGWSAGPVAGRQTGAVGRVGAYSFNGNKIATTGGGGMVVTDDPDLAARARHLTTQAKVPDVGYLHDEVGYNYRLTNVAAALGLAQLERLDEFVDRKRAIAARYDEAIRGTGLVAPPRVDGPRRHLLALLGPGPRRRPPRARRLPRPPRRPGRRSAGALAAAARPTAVCRCARPRRRGRRGGPLPPWGLPAVRDRAHRGRPGAGGRRGPVVLGLTAGAPGCPGCPGCRIGS